MAGALLLAQAAAPVVTHFVIALGHGHHLPHSSGISFLIVRRAPHLDVNESCREFIIFEECRQSWAFLLLLHTAVGQSIENQ